jgi:hypothetical protein
MAVAVNTISQFLGLRTDTPASKCSLEYSPDCADVVFSVGGVSTRPPLRVELTMPAEIVYDKEFQGRDGNTYRVVVDINGAMWSVASSGIPTQIDSVVPGASVTSVTAYGREYMAFFNANGGCDAPRQWDGKNLYRVAQGGPGAAAVFAPSELTTDKYQITGIRQPAAQSRGYSYFLQSSGPGSTTPGTTVTFYYSDSTLAGPDTDLVDAFNSGFPVYVYASFTGGPSVQGPYTVLVTDIGEAQPPGQSRKFYYFTFEVLTTAYIYYQGSGHGGYTANYQRTLATITTGTAVPGVSVGDNITITGASVSAWNADWAVQQTPLSGAMAVTQVSLTGGVATYNYQVTSGVAPIAGESITVTITTDNPLNVTNGTIASATGGALGSFTVAGFAGTDIPPESVSGTAVTAGTEFLIDPALLVVGTSTSPIYPASNGGYIVFAGTTATISPGDRQAVVFFITETDFDTAPGPIAKFTIPANTNAIAVSGLPIGPANVKARAVALTPANGSRFFCMLLPSSVNGVITGTSTVVNDNTSDTATFVFSDDALQTGIAIDVPGNNLFQQVTLDTPNSVEWYDDRLFWGGGRNKVTSLINMEMDGGTSSGSANPLGWTMIGESGAVQQVGSAPAYVVTGPGTGEISQPAAKTANYGAPITHPNQAYTLRLWSSGASGNAVGTLSSASTGFTSTATVSLTQGYISADFELKTPAVVPDDLVFDFKITGLPAGLSVAVRDLQLIYTTNPNRNPIARASYTQNPEAYDQETGNIGPNDDNTELRAMFVLNESFHFLTARALYYVSAIGNSEPSSWDPKQISSDCGAFNANAVVLGQGWAAWAGPLGFFKYGVWAPGYFGGLPENMSNLIAPTWNSLGGLNNVFNDAAAQRVYIGTPGNMLVLDYHELLSQGPPKWTVWNRVAQWISAQGFAIGKKVYALDTAPGTDDDDLGPVGGYYTFAPMGASMFQKQYDYLGFQIGGQGPLTPFLYTKTLQDEPYALNMSPLENLLDTVAEWQSLALRGRLLFLKLGQPGVRFSLEAVASSSQLDPNAPISGVR